MLLSVIIPNYNNGRYLNECIDSVLSQTFNNFEIIISDDSSTDNSINIIKGYINKYPNKVRGIFSSINTGVSATRLRAIVKAKGEYITTIDSDDYYCNYRKLEEEMSIINYYNIVKQQNVCVYSNAIFVTKGGTFIKVKGVDERIKEGDLLKYFITRSCEIPINFILKRKKYFDVGGYDISLPIFEDWDLKIRISKHCHFYYTGISGTAYRRHNEGLSSSPPELKIENLWKVFNKNIMLIPESERVLCRNKFSTFMKNKAKQLKIQ